MTIGGDFLTNLAASLAYDLLKAGTARLKTSALGEPAQVALRGSYEAGFRAMLEVVAARLDRDHQALVEGILREFVGDPVVASLLLDIALVGAELRDLSALRDRFAAQFDLETLPVDFDRALTAFHSGLTEALVFEASRPESPLFNRLIVARMDELARQLEQIARNVSTFADKLELIERVLGQRIVAIGGDVSSSIIITGDGNRVTIADDGHLAQDWHDLRMTDAEAEVVYRDLVAALDERLSFPLSGLSFNAMLEEVYQPLPITRVRPGYDWRPIARSWPDDWLELDEMLQADGPKALLGLLGEGKTTTLHYLNWAYACRPESQLLWRLHEIVPFYLTARDLARARQEGDDLVSICAGVVTRRLGHPHLRTALVQRVLQSTLNTGNALILMDALDEHRASDAERSDLLEWLAGVWRTQPFQDNLLLLTSRPYAFLQAGFQAYALQAPEVFHAGDLAYRLGRVLLRDQGVADAKQRERLRNITDLMHSPQMRDFASPFYITLLTLAICRSSHFGEGLAQARAIERLADLYRFFLRQTIHWERGKPGATEVDEGVAYQALAELGWQTFVEQPWRERLAAELLPAGDRHQARAFWQRTGLMQEDVFTGEWHFYHTGFQLFGVALMLGEAWKRGQQTTIDHLQKETIGLMDWDTIWLLFFGLRGGEYGRGDTG